MGTPPSDANDDDLAQYVKSRLEQIGPYFAEAEIVADALGSHRDLWLRLYEIDRDFANDGS